MQQVEEVDSWRGSRRSRAANSHDETLSKQLKKEIRERPEGDAVPSKITPAETSSCGLERAESR